MKKTSLLIAATSLCAAYTATAASGIFGSYIGLNVNGGGNTWYDADSTTALANFEGLSIGEFDLTSSDSLQLSAFELDTFKNFGSDVTGAQLEYRVFELGETPGSFNTVGGGFVANANFTDPAGTLITGGGDQNWGVAPTANLADLLSGTVAGKTYEVEIFMTSFNSDGNAFANAGGSNFTASFTTVPEPGTYALLAGIVGLAYVATRRRLS